jgi:hypothetical protein
MADRRIGDRLDEWIEEHDHAKPVHPGRALWQRHFYLDGLFNTEGAMWVVLVDGLIFIPVVFAAFFYPWQALFTALAILVTSFAALQLWVRWARKGL